MTTEPDRVTEFRIWLGAAVGVLHSLADLLRADLRSGDDYHDAIVSEFKRIYKVTNGHAATPPAIAVVLHELKKEVL